MSIDRNVNYGCVQDLCPQIDVLTKFTISQICFQQIQATRPQLNTGVQAWG